MALKDWSTTPASNNSAAPNGWPESTMLVNQINDTGRQMMADVRAWYEDAQWIDYGHTPSRVSATVFSVPGTHSGTYSVNRRIRVADASTYLGSISDVTAAGGITSVTLALDTGSLTGSLSAVSVAAVTGDSLPDSVTSALTSADIGATVQAYDADTTKNDVANSFTAIQKWAKGADIASATALTLGTDGNYFDVAGTTTITSINTVGVGTWVCLHFDAALTLTHHATDLILPGAANITTAAGDEAIFIEYATADWRCVSYTKASGEPVVAGGGGLVLLSSQTASGAASITFTTGIDSTYDAYLFVAHNLVAGTDNVSLHAKLSTDGGSTFLTTHAYFGRSVRQDGIGASGAGTTGANQIVMMSAAAADGLGTSAGSAAAFKAMLFNPASASLFKGFAWEGAHWRTGNFMQDHGSGGVATTTAVNAIQFILSSGNITGTIRMYGVAAS